MPLPHPQINTYTDDALGEADAVELAAAVRSGERSAAELARAAIARAQSVEPVLHAVAYAAYEQAPTRHYVADAALAGVPSYVKDLTDVAGMPTNHGTACFVAKPAKKDSAVTAQHVGTGVVVLGKTRVPEFGFNGAGEFRYDEPVRNPWNPDYSPGGSSSGAAALVAAGVVPIAHATDGGGSIRIPAACNGLIGLKASRGRFADGPQAKSIPLNVNAEGVVTRTVRDTATYVAAAERFAPAKNLPPIGHVQGPGTAKLRIGLLFESPAGAPTDDQTRHAIERTAKSLEAMGHRVEPAAVTFGPQFADDFVAYWGLLAFLATRTGRLMIDRRFDSSRADGLTLGLRRHFQRRPFAVAPALRRLKASSATYAEIFTQHDVVLSPVLAHVPPKIGFLSPEQPFEQLMDKLRNYVAFTPLNNASGGPAISVPAGFSSNGVPIGAHLSAKVGDEATLLRVAFALEESGWPTS